MSKLPQATFFKQLLQFRGSSGNDWSISGHSRAMERTGFILKGPGIICILDAGIDVPSPSFPPIDVILVTHTHIDHANALPMLLRHTYNKTPETGMAKYSHIFSPVQTMHRLREFVQLSWSMKVNEGEEIPLGYQNPDVLTEYVPGEPTYTTSEEPFRRWYGMKPDIEVELMLGKRGNCRIFVQGVDCDHTISTCGYIITEERKQLRQDLVCESKAETQRNVKEALARKDTVNVLVKCPLVSFLCDTTVNVFNPSPYLETIFSSSLILVECTYLESSYTDEAIKRGHIVWTDLYPIIKTHWESCLSKDHNGSSHKQDITTNDNNNNNSDDTSSNTDNDRNSNINSAISYPTWVLIHFSLRYSDSDIKNFFKEQHDLILEECNYETATAKLADNDKNCRPPNIILWLDSGLSKIWLK